MNLRDNYQRDTALLVATASNRDDLSDDKQTVVAKTVLDIVKALVEAKADVNASKGAVTRRPSAARNGHHESIKILRDAGANDAHTDNSQHRAYLRGTKRQARMHKTSPPQPPFKTTSPTYRT